MTAAVIYDRRLEADWKPPKQVGGFGICAPGDARTVFLEACFDARDNGEIDMGAVLVAHFLAGMLDHNLQNEQGLFPTQRYIATSISKSTGGSYSTSWANRKLRQLRAAGLIDWCHRFLPRKGEVRATSNVYALTLPSAFVEKVAARQKAARAKRTEKKVAAKQAAMATPKARMNAHPEAAKLNAIYLTAANLDAALDDLDLDDVEARELMAARFLQHYDQLE